MATIRKLGGDSAADTVWSEVDSLAQNLARFADIVGNGKLIRLECQHIRNYCAEIRKLNNEHRRGYDPAADDSASVLVDRIGHILHSDEFAPSVGHWFLIDMRACVTRLRKVIYERMWSDQLQAQTEPQHEQRRANHG